MTKQLVHRKTLVFAPAGFAPSPKAGNAPLKSDAQVGGPSEEPDLLDQYEQIPITKISAGPAQSIPTPIMMQIKGKRVLVVKGIPPSAPPAPQEYPALTRGIDVVTRKAGDSEKQKCAVNSQLNIDSYSVDDQVADLARSGPLTLLKRIRLDQHELLESDWEKESSDDESGRIPGVRRAAEIVAKHKEVSEYVGSLRKECNRLK